MANPQAFYEYLAGTNTRLVGNIMYPDSPGHMIAELDNFLRMRHLGEIDNNCNYLAITHKSVLGLPEIIAETFHKTFNSKSRIQIISNDELNKFASEIHLLRPEMVVDVGVSHFKNALASEIDRKKARLMHLAGRPQMLTWIITHEMLANCTLQYFRRRYESRDYCPFADIPDLSPELRQLVGDNNKIALIHIRSNDRGTGISGNAGTRTDPESFHPTLAYLRDSNFTIVKIGREPYPHEWRRFSVINYSESGLQNYKNDLFLLKSAKFIMIDASGFGVLSDILETPMVYYGVWHLGYPFASPNCVTLPTLMRDKSTGRLLRFGEQLHYFKELPEYWERGDCMNFPKDTYEERKPTAAELLASAQEAIALGTNPTPRSPTQERFVDLDRKGFFAHIRSRISQQLLDNLPDALTPGFIEY